jgi:hypothetical protein
VTRATAAVLTVLSLLFVAAAPARAQTQTAAQSPEAVVAESLRIDWKKMEERSGVEGFVYNDSPYRIGLVQIRVMGRDPGQEPAPTLAWVYGNVPARGRTYFRARVPQGREIVDVVIDSFRLIARDPPPESP